MDSIDSFIGIPILISITLGLLLFGLLIIAKIRNTSKISAIVFPSILIFIAGLAYSFFSQKMIFGIFSAAIVEFLLMIYGFVLAVSDPMKREKSGDALANPANEEDNVDKAQLKAELNKTTKLLETNIELTQKASSFFGQEDALSGFLEHFNNLIVEKTLADGCAIMLLDDYDEILAVKSVTGLFPPPYKLPDDIPHKPLRVETNFKFSQFELEGNIFGDIFNLGEPVNIKDPSRDKRVVQNGPEDFLKCGPYMFIPVKGQDVTIGLVCLSRKADAMPFTPVDFENAVSLTEAFSNAIKPLNSFLSVTEHLELTKEGDIATKYQKTMVPEKLPVLNSLSIGKYSTQMENVCGDYYDIIPSRKDRITFVMSDVAGKGMNSLVVMIMLRAMLRLISNTNQSSATLLEWVNKAICSEKNSMDHFASVALINYNSINNSAQISTSGTCPVILYKSQDGSIQKISSECEPIGVVKETKYSDIDIQLQSGDILVTCTDGLLECLNESGVQYSLDNLQKVIKTNCKLSGKDIAAKVKDNIKKFCGNAQQYDDQSLLVIKIQG